jgi:HK97 family phage major capsid protein
VDERRARTRLGRRDEQQGDGRHGHERDDRHRRRSALGVTAASATAITYNELLDLEHSVDPAYRPEREVHVGTTATLKAVKKLVDSNSRPLWIAGGVSEGVQNRRPDTSTATST